MRAVKQFQKIAKCYANKITELSPGNNIYDYQEYKDQKSEMF